MNRNVPLRANPDKPLRSKTGLSRSTGLGRNTASRGAGFSPAGRTRLRPAGAATGQRKPPGEFTPKVKLVVRRRAGGGDIFSARCEGCGRWLGGHAGEFQHRRARGSGGCRDEVINGPANALLLCGSAALRTGCHGEAEERRRDLSQDGAGWWIVHGVGLDFDPRFVAVMLGALGDSGVTVWLGTDGHYLDRPPLEAVA